MARLLLLLLFAAGLYFFFRWLFLQPARVRLQVVLVLAALVLLVLVLTGRAHWLAALVAAALPFLRGLLNLVGVIPLIKRILAGRGAASANSAPAGGQTSTVQSKYVRMTLDHDSGDIDGEVLAGNFRGKPLGELDLDALLQLLHECQDDGESVSLLQAYLDRMYTGEWQERAGAEGEPHTAEASGELSRQEALQILGLSVDAGEAEIVEAHRRLMQKLHPDRGGSAYLAARINQAKDKLLGG